MPVSCNFVVHSETLECDIAVDSEVINFIITSSHGDGTVCVCSMRQAAERQKLAEQMAAEEDAAEAAAGK